MTTLLAVPSGTIDLETRGRDQYLQFNCDCPDALPFCRARCCTLPGLLLTEAEHASGRFPLAVIQDRAPQLPRRPADGYCVHNGPDRRCQVYADRPEACRNYHCSRGGRPGWRVTPP
jgi:Fe-S-cluster containining protein